jgi:hypothetical protein
VLSVGVSVLCAVMDPACQSYGQPYNGYVYFDSGAMLTRLKQGGTVIDVYRYIRLMNAVMMQGYDWLKDCGLC